MKHWTEPNGVFLIQIPIEWQYTNTAVVGGVEEPPFSFEPYDGPVGCFQVSCYPLAALAPESTDRTSPTDTGNRWKHSKLSESGFDAYLVVCQNSAGS